MVNKLEWLEVWMRNVVQLIKGLASNCWKMQKNISFFVVACLQGFQFFLFVSFWADFFLLGGQKSVSFFSSCANKEMVKERRLKCDVKRSRNRCTRFVHEVNGTKSWFFIVGRQKMMWKKKEKNCMKIKEDPFWSCFYALHKQCKCTLNSLHQATYEAKPFIVASFFYFAFKDTKKK